MSSLTKLFAALQCPACDPPRCLRAPITLRCGHSICAEHVLRTNESPATNASSTPFTFFHSIWSSCPLQSCNQPPQGILTDSSDQNQKSGHKSDSQLSDAPNNPKVIFLPSRATNFENRSASDEKEVSGGIERPATDVLVSKLLSLAERYRRSFRIFDSIAQHRESRSTSIERLTPAPLDSSTPASGCLPSVSQTNSPRREVYDLNVELSDDSPDQETSEALEHELSHELTCEICLMLIYKPITTPCQHTFCARCLGRSLDHSDRCPLCRQDLFGYAYFQGHPINKLISSLVMEIFPDEYQDRGEQVEQEGKDARLDTPIFICQLSFPGMPTLLHFFEPRYRLMLRRCLEQENPAFGMIMPAPPGGTTDYGTMLDIRSVQMLPDGRSMVETFGAHRFRIAERGTIDGYMVGRVERIDDVDSELEAEHIARTVGLQRRGPEPSNEEMITICREFVEQLRSGMAPWVVQRLNHTYGPMPDDISDFTFWMGLILPLDEHEKAKLLPIRSPRLRLRLLVHWIEQLNSQWWFMNGCNIM